MKKVFLLFPLLSFLLLSSCTQKEGFFDKDYDKKEETYDKNHKDYNKDTKQKEENLPICTWNEAAEASGPEWEKLVVKPLITSADCDCIESGYLKFLKNGKTAFLIIYSNKECSRMGYKVTCVDGDCEDKQATKCVFEQDCSDGE